jgi:transcription antitermination protein NusB
VWTAPAPVGKSNSPVPSRRKTREFVLQVLFAADARNEDPLETLAFLENHFSAEEEEDLKMHRVTKEFAHALVDAVSRDRAAIDDLITRLSQHWKLHRINRVDRNILRMAIAEMTNFSQTPGRVVLDEAIEIGKRYGAENSAAFINGILDRIHALLNRSPGTLDLKEMIAVLDESNSTD